MGDEHNSLDQKEEDGEDSDDDVERGYTIQIQSQSAMHSEITRQIQRTFYSMAEDSVWVCSLHMHIGSHLGYCSNRDPNPPARAWCDIGLAMQCHRAQELQW